MKRRAPKTEENRQPPRDEDVLEWMAGGCLPGLAIGGSKAPLGTEFTYIECLGALARRALGQEGP